MSAKEDDKIAPMDLMTSVPAHTVNRHDTIIINNRPCRVIQISYSKGGKAKIELVGIDIIDHSKHEVVLWPNDQVLVPEVNRTEYQLLYLSDEGHPILMLPDGSDKEISTPVSEEIKQLHEEGKELMLITISALGRETVIGHRVVGIDLVIDDKRCHI